MEDEKDIKEKLNALNIELLKQTSKRKRIRREIAKILTRKNQTKRFEKTKILSGGKQKI